MWFVLLVCFTSFQDKLLFPRMACFAPTIAEAGFEDTNNEHSLLESNELRLITILKQCVKCLQTQPDVVPTKQVNRLKRQLRSYQTLILPHLNKEEEKYTPVLLHRFSPQQWQVLLFHFFELYGSMIG